VAAIAVAVTGPIQAGNVSGQINNSVAVAVGDFNGDGLGDLAVTNQLDSTVSIHMGTGAGFFAPRELLSAPGNPGSIGVADLNGDGNDDLAVSTFGGSFNSRVRVYDGNGAGGASGFTQSAVLPVANAPVSLKIDDVAGDTRPDILVASAQNNPDQVTVLTNLGNNNYSRQDLASGNQFNEVTHWLLDTADLDNNGFKDIVVVNDGTTVSIWFGSSGGFGARTTRDFGFLIASIAIGEFNGDGFLDLAATSRQNVASVGSAAIGIKLGDGIGGFGQVTNFATVEPNHIRSFVIGDVDGDTLPDLVLGTNPMSVHFGMASDITAYASPAGDFSTLVKNADGTYTRTTKNGTRIEFDAAGLQTAIIDRNGNTTSFAYDGQDRLTTITDPAATLVTTLAYGGDGKLDTVTDPAGRITSFVHDSAGDLTRIIDPDLSERDFAYDARHRVTAQDSKRDFTTTYEYGFHGRFVQSNRPDGSTRKLAPAQVVGVVDTSLGFGSVGNPGPLSRPEDVKAVFTDGRDNQRTAMLDLLGAATSITDQLGRVTLITRDADGLPTSITRAAGTPDASTRSFTYDGKGNALTAIEVSIGATTTFSYDPNFSLLISYADAKGNPPASIVRDGNGNAMEVTDSAGTRSTFEFADPACPGLVTTIATAVGLPEQTIRNITYDPITCNRISSIDQVGNETQFTHDAAGNIATVTEAFGTADARTTQRFYDALNRLERVIDANLDETLFDYDEAGNVAVVTDANLNVTNYEYEPLERLARVVDPLLADESFFYDENGNLETYTDRKLQTSSFVYDAANRTTSKSLPGPLVRSFGYDLRDNLVSITDPDSILSMTYDGADRMLTESTAGAPNQPSVTLTFNYDKNGNRLTMDDGVVGVTNYIFEQRNLLDTLSAPGQGAINFEYDALHRRTGISRPNGADTTFVWDAASRLTSIEHVLGLTTFSSFVYGHDARSNRNSLDQVRSALSVEPALTLDYDSIDQITSATHPVPASPIETFTYDASGNRIRRDGQSTDSIIGLGNRLAEDALYTYAYDTNGNLETRTRKSTGAVTSYTWDPENRLIRIDFPDLTFAAYSYDGLHRRIEKDDDGNVTRYVYDRADILLEYDGLNTLLARYTHGLGIDEPLVMERDGNGDELFAASERFHYQADGLGSVTDITDQFGVVVRAYVYDTFGGIAQETGTLANPYTYTGREFDIESGLYFYRARYYDPNAGRFLSEDPIRYNSGEINLYRYVRNSPMGGIDPFGKDYIDIGVAGGFNIGATGGVMLTIEGGNLKVYPYSGPGVTVAPATLGVSAGAFFHYAPLSDPSTGDFVTVGGNAGISVQYGEDVRGNNQFAEFGFGVGTPSVNSFQIRVREPWTIPIPGVCILR